MKIADTISVNPGKNTLGHVETSNPSLLRRQVISRKEAETAIDMTKVIFPSVSSGLSEFRKYDLPLRIVFATILLVSGLSMLTVPMGVHTISFAIVTLCFGTFLALGFLTRPVMLGAAVYYCITGALSLRAGAPDVSVFSLMFGSLIFAVVGAGKYSCDTLLRSAIRRFKKNSELKSKEVNLGYKAFHEVKY